jgi:hypothetical protein
MCRCFTQRVHSNAHALEAAVVAAGAVLNSLLLEVKVAACMAERSFCKKRHTPCVVSALSSPALCKPCAECCACSALTSRTSMLGFREWVKQHLANPLPHAPVLSLSLLNRRKRRAAAEVLLSTPELDDLLDRGESRVTFQRHLEIHVVPNRDELSHYHKARLWWTRDDYLAFREAYYDYLLSQERSESSESDASVSCDDASFCLHIRLVWLHSRFTST